MKNNFLKILRSVYTTPNHPASFTSPVKIQQTLKKQYNIIKPLSEIQSWLNEQRSYSLHRRALHTFQRNPTIVSNIDEQWQADLFFLPHLRSRNQKGKHQICLICIDIASRYVWVQPVKTKSGINIANAMRQILLRSHPRKPKKLQTDNGTEFFNSTFGQLMNEYDIIHFSNRSDTTKAAVVERVIRTIKEKIYRALDNTPHFKNDWVSIVQPLVDSYNNTFHVSIQTAPAEVNQHNVGDILDTLYRQYWVKDRKWKEPHIKENDYVRISAVRFPFRKGYKGNWKEEIFKVYQIKYCLPNNLYKLEDLEGEKLLGTFYPHELQKVNHSPTEATFKIQSILRRRVRNGSKEIFVRWQGYPDSHNSWIKEDNVIDVKEDDA